MICKKCNHNLPGDSEFCQYCGTKMPEKNNIEANNPIENNKSVKKITLETESLPIQSASNEGEETHNTPPLKKHNAKFKILLISGIALISCLVIIVAMLLGSYFLPRKPTEDELAAKAENAVAVYLSNYPFKYRESFVTFESTYYTITKSDSKYTVELGGGAHNSKQKIVSFSATVEIDMSSGKAQVKKVSFDREKLL